MKIICVGRNYVDHAKELGNEVPTEPVIFMKPKSAILQAHTPFYYPEFTNELHYECELVMRISKNGKYIQERHASNYYNGITLGIDFTARDIQDECKKKGLPWEKAKAFDEDITGEPTGGTRTAVMYARELGIETFNIRNKGFDADELITRILGRIEANREIASK